MDEKLEEIKKKVTNPETALHISRVPKNTNREFKEWCKEEFEGDYGMGLKWLWDFRKGMFVNPNEELNQKIEILAEEISAIKEQPKPKKKVIRSVNGKVITEKKEE